MKKTISLILILVMCVFASIFTGCEFWETKTDEYGFFANTDLPKIRSDKPTKMEYGTFYYTTTQEEFNQYVNLLYEHLISKEYEYLGTPVKIIDDTFFGASPRCEIELGEKLEDYLAYDLQFYVRGKRLTNSYFFVLGNQLLEDKDGAPDGYTQVHGGYIKLGYSSHTSTDKDGFTYNAYIKLPHGLYGYSFYLPKTISGDNSQNSIIKSGFDYTDEVSESTPWIATAIECSKKQQLNANLSIYVGHERNFIDNWNTNAWNSNPGYGKFVIQRTILDSSGNSYSQEYFDLDDFGDDKYLVSHIYDENTPGKIIGVNYAYGFKDALDFSDIDLEKGYIQYKFCLVDDDYQIITEALNFGISYHSHVSFSKDELYVTFSEWNGFYQ